MTSAPIRNNFGGGRSFIAGHLDIPNLGTTPTISACGTSPGFTGPAASDSRVEVIKGSGASACTVTFAKAYNSKPVCVIESLTSGNGVTSYDAETGYIQWNNSGTAGTFDVICEGN